MASSVAQLTAKLALRIGAESAHNELRWLGEAFKNPRSLLYISQENPPPALLDDKLTVALNERLKDKPLQYIIGTQPFGHIEIKCRPPVLIPRPETEHWTLQLAKRFRPTPKRRLKVLDLGCGTGCISLLLAKIWEPGSTWVHAVDINPDAVLLAQENARDLGLSLDPDDGVLSYQVRKDQNTPSVFTSEVADWTSDDWQIHGWERHCTSGYFDVVVCNPPYIPWKDYNDLDPGVRDWEDKRALVGDVRFYQAIADRCAKSTKATKPLVKRPTGVCVMEISPELLSRIRPLFQKDRALKGLEVWSDQYGQQRALWGNTGKLQLLPLAPGWKLEDGHMIQAEVGEPILLRGRKKRITYNPEEIASEETNKNRGIWGKP